MSKKPKKKTHGWINPLFTFKNDAFDLKTGERSPLSLLNSMYWFKNIPNSFVSSKNKTIDSFLPLFKHSEEKLKQLPIPDDLIEFLDEFRLAHPETWDPKHPKYQKEQTVYEESHKRSSSPPKSPKASKKQEIDLTKEPERKTKILPKTFHDLLPKEEEQFKKTVFTFPFPNSHEKMENCDTFLIQWSENSCWLDSVLMMYFTVIQPFFVKYFLIKKLYHREEGPSLEVVCSENPKEDYDIREKLRKNLKEFFDTLNGTKKREKCANFRKLFSDCSALKDLEVKKAPGRFGGIGAADVVEFNQLLLGLFEVNLNVFQQTSKAVHVESVDVPTISIPISNSLKDQEKIGSFQNMLALSWGLSEATDFVSQKTGAVVLKTIRSEVMFVQYYNPLHPSLIPLLCPKNVDWKTEYKPFNPNIDINVGGKSESKYRLAAMIVGQFSTVTIHGATILRHFTLIMRCKNTWFRFDDDEKQIEKVGSYENVISKLQKPGEDKPVQGVFIACYIQQ